MRIKSIKGIFKYNSSTETPSLETNWEECSVPSVAETKNRTLEFFSRETDSVRLPSSPVVSLLWHMRDSNSLPLCYESAPWTRAPKLSKWHPFKSNCTCTEALCPCESLDCVIWIVRVFKWVAPSFGIVRGNDQFLPLPPFELGFTPGILPLQGGQTESIY